MPLSVLIPAPVKTTARSASVSQRAIWPIALSIVRSLLGGGIILGRLRIATFVGIADSELSLA